MLQVEGAALTLSKTSCNVSSGDAVPSAVLALPLGSTWRKRELGLRPTRHAMRLRRAGQSSAATFARPLTRAEVAAFADAIKALLDDSDADLSRVGGCDGKVLLGPSTTSSGDHLASSRRSLTASSCSPRQW